MSSSPSVSVVIPTWNGRDLLAAALASLRRQTLPSPQIVVVDNGSSDGTAEMLRRDHPDVRLLRFEENRGFAPAVNAGIRASSGDVVALMNNDVEADPGWLEALAHALEANPRAGAAASRMLAYADHRRIDSAGVRLGLYASQIGEGELDGAAFARPAEVFAACAGAAAYRRRALDQVGLFDERFFAYFEDVDIGARLQLAGWRCVYVPDAIVYHHGSATSKRVPATRFYLLMRNSLFLFFQYMPPRRLPWAPAVLAWPFVRAVLDRQPLSLAGRAVRDFIRDLPAVRQRRAQVRAGFTRDYRARLASPFARRGGKPAEPEASA